MKTFNEWLKERTKTEGIFSRSPMKFPNVDTDDSIFNALGRMFTGNINFGEKKPYEMSNSPNFRTRNQERGSRNLPIAEFDPKTRIITFTNDGTSKRVPPGKNMKGMVKRDETGQLYRVRWV